MSQRDPSHGVLIGIIVLFIERASHVKGAGWNPNQLIWLWVDENWGGSIDSACLIFALQINQDERIGSYFHLPQLFSTLRGLQLGGYIDAIAVVWMPIEGQNGDWGGILQQCMETWRDEIFQCLTQRPQIEKINLNLECLPSLANEIHPNAEDKAQHMDAL